MPTPASFGPLGPLLDDDAAFSTEDARLIRQVEAELKPVTALGGVLARRVGLLSARLERSGRHEAATLDQRVAHAAEAFDLARLAEVDRLMSYIAAEPAAHARSLRSSPEGVDRMLRAWRSIRLDLHVQAEERWTFSHQMLAENLMGRRVEDLPMSRVHVLSQAIWNNAKFLEPAEREGRDSRAIRAWAKGELDGWIADQINDLEAHRATLDLDRIARDRAGAADRALFDPSPAATLARKYDAATERSLHRTLREFRQVEADHRAAPAASPKPIPEPAPLASFRQADKPAAPPIPRPQPAPLTPPIRSGEGPMSIGPGPQ